MFELPGQSVDDGKELANVVRTVFVGARVKYLLPCLGDDSAIFKLAGRAIAGGIHAYRRGDRLNTRGFPSSIRRGFALVLLVFH